MASQPLQQISRTSRLPTRAATGCGRQPSDNVVNRTSSLLAGRAWATGAMRVRGIVLACLVSAVISACSGPRQRMPYGLIAQLELGVTTAAEAEALLGAPEETAALPDGGEEWRYFFAPEPPVGADGLPAPSNAHEQPEVLLLVLGPAPRVVMHWEATRSVFGVRDAAHPSEPDHQAIRDIPLP